jgi:hypothetical protein
MKSLAAVALAVLLTCGAAACSSGHSSTDPPDNGPLSSGRSATDIPGGVQCAPGGEGPITFGDQVYTNYGHTTVTLDRIVLTDPHNQRIIGAYAMPLPATESVVGTVQWPVGTTRGFPLPATWKDRQAVHGYQVAPGKTFNMVLGLAPVGAGRATSSGTLVYYRDAAGTYVAKNDFQNIIAATKTGCN